MEHECSDLGVAQRIELEERRALGLRELVQGIVVRVGAQGRDKGQAHLPEATGARQKRQGAQREVVGEIEVIHEREAGPGHGRDRQGVADGQREAARGGARA